MDEYPKLHVMLFKTSVTMEIVQKSVGCYYLLGISPTNMPWRKVLQRFYFLEMENELEAFSEMEGNRRFLVKWHRFAMALPHYDQFPYIFHVI